MTDDVVLVRREREFEDFYRSSYRHVFRITWALAGDGAADELAQEALLLAHRRWSEVRDLDDPLGWVKRVARNMAISRFRRRQAELRALVRIGGREQITMSEPAVELWSAVRSLPPRQREAVVLCYLEGMSRSEVAAEMGIGVETVKTHLERARRSLSEELGSRDD